MRPFGWDLTPNLVCRECSLRFPACLTRRRSPTIRAAVAFSARFAPVLPSPFVIKDLGVFGEDAAGAFHLLHRYALTG
jgi:hypothetical protein